MPLRFLFLVFVCYCNTFAASLFTFDNDAPDSYTPFSDVDNGMTAIFTSNGDPGGFSLTPYQSASLSGNVLFQPGPAGLDNLALQIGFSQPIAAIALNFAINGPATQAITLTALQGTTAVGSVTGLGSVTSGALFPEGLLTFSFAGSFDNVVLDSEALDFAIDNVAVTPAGSAPVVPEPSTMSLLGVAAMAATGMGAARLGKEAYRKVSEFPDAFSPIPGKDFSSLLTGCD